MAVMAKWGPKTWTVSPQKIVALQDLSFSYSQAADNNTSIEEKKTTNERGTELFPLSFTTVLHAGAGVDIWEEIESWKNLVTKVDYFYLGGRQLGPQLQLRKVSVGSIKTDDMGRIWTAALSFEFKEYDPDTSSAEVNTSALDVKAGTTAKEQMKTANTAVQEAEKKTVRVGDYVKPIGTKYATGQTIPEWVKQRSHKVSQIKESQNRVLLGSPDGINSWVYLSEVSLV